MEPIKFDDLSAEMQEEFMAQYEAQKEAALLDEAIEALQGGDFDYLELLHGIQTGKELY